MDISFLRTYCKGVRRRYLSDLRVKAEAVSELRKNLTGRFENRLLSKLQRIGREVARSLVLAQHIVAGETKMPASPCANDRSVRPSRRRTAEHRLTAAAFEAYAPNSIK